MKHEKIMKKIMEQLTVYKGIVDSLSGSYMADKKAHEEELQRMQGMYTPEYIAEYDKNWKPSRDYSGEISMAREKTSKIALSCLDNLKKEMDRYFQIPVDSGFAATITAVKSLGVTLNNQEFKLLQEASGGYWGLRLLNELGVSRTKTGEKTVLEDGEIKISSKETKIPYGAVDLPDIEKAYDSLQNVRNAVNMAFESYCGEDYALKDVVLPLSKAVEETNAKLKEEYGVSPKQTRDVLTISRMASSVRCFDENYPSYTDFSEMMGGLLATMPKPKKKTSLMDADRKLIDTLINPKYPALAKDEAVKIAKSDSRLAEILALDERYGTAVKEALGEVSDNE